MRQRFYPVIRRLWWLGWLCLLVLVSGSVSCLRTRGAMYLQKERVGVYLDRTRGSEPPKGVDFNTFLEWRARLADMPDGNRILGGFCTDPEVQPALRAMDALRPTCQRRLYRESTSANLQGRLFWGFLTSTIVAGGGAIGFAAGALATQGSTSTALGITAAAFGTGALLTALVNGLGGFDARQERYKIRAQIVDNFMWSLRQRVIVEVCNAKSRAVAVQQAVYIYNLTQRYCTSDEAGDGYYRIPTGGARFDSRTLPPAPPAPPPPRVEPPRPPANNTQPPRPPADNTQPPKPPADTKEPGKPGDTKEPPAADKEPTTRPEPRKDTAPPNRPQPR